MKKILVNGKEITTNYGEKGMSTLVTGDDLPNYVIDCSIVVLICM